MQESKAAPRHLGLILDGNRRWAKQNNRPSLDGHREGAEVFRKMVYAAFDRGIEYISAWVFSTENWRRTQEEVSFLMSLVIKVADKYLDEFHEKGIRILFLGSKEGLSDKVASAVDKVITKTANNQNGTVALCFNYGGKQEIIDAIKKLPDTEKSNLTPDSFEQYLYSSQVPDIDLIIRTSGEKRTGGFMMWRSTYAELLFVDKLWPDFTTDDLDEAIEEYKRRDRRFGK